MWQSWQVTPALRAGLSRYWSQTISSLMPRLTATWWQLTQNSDLVIWSFLIMPLWMSLPRPSVQVLTE